MPLETDLPQAYNFAGPVHDDVFPWADDSMDTNDLPWLFGYYQSEYSLIEVVKDVIGVGGNPKSILDHEGVAVIHDEWDNVDPGPPDLVSPGLMGTQTAARVTTTSIGFVSQDVATSVTRQVFSVKWAMHLTNLGDTPTDVLMLRIFAASQTILVIQGLIEDVDASNKNFYCFVREDGGATTESTHWSVSKAVEHGFEVRLTKASSAVASDGKAEYFMDGVLQASTTGLDLYDNIENIDEVMFGEAPDNGSYDFDEVIISEPERTTNEVLYHMGMVRVISEVVNLVESIIRPIGFVKIISEVVNLVESIIRPIGFVKIISEVVNIQPPWSILRTGYGSYWGFAEFNNKLYATSSTRVWEYDGVNWTESYFVAGEDPVVLAVYNSKLYMGTWPGGKVYEFNGSSWSLSYDTTQTAAQSMAVYSGSLYVGTGISGRIYEYDGAIWSLAYDSPEGWVFGLEVYDGALYAGTGNAGKVYKFNGSSWSEEYDSTSTAIRNMAVYNGALYAGTSTDGKVFKFNGSSWSEELDTTELYIYDMYTFGDYLYFVTGDNGYIYQYDGTNLILVYDSAETKMLGLGEFNSQLYAGGLGKVYVRQEALKVLGMVRVISEVVNIVESIITVGVFNALIKIINEVVNVVDTNLRPRALVRVLSEVVNIIEATLHLKGMVRVIDEVVNIHLRGMSNILIDHEEENFSDYTTPPAHQDCYDFVTPGLNGTVWALQVAATNYETYAEKTFTAPASTYFELSFYLDMSCFTLISATTEILRITDSLNDITLAVRPLTGGGSGYEPTGVRFTLTPDTGTTNFDTTVTRIDPHHYRLALYKASSAVASDGWAELYTDGSLTNSAYGLDLFDDWAKLTNLKVGLFNNPGMDGHYLIDEIGVNTDSSTGIYILNTILTFIINETVTVAENIVRFPSQIIRIVSEVVNVVSSSLTKGSLIQIVNETVNVVTSVLGNVGLLKIVNETVNVVSALVRKFAIVQVISEVVNVAETNVKLSNLIKIIAEVVTLVDTNLRPRALARIVNEVVRVSEVTLSPRTLARIVNETVNLIESLLAFRPMTHIINEVVTLVDTNLRLSGLVRVINEVVNMVSSVLRPVGLVRVINEVVTLVDTNLRARALARIVNEVVRVPELAIRPISHLVKIISETVNVVSSSKRVTGLAIVINETVNVVSSVLKPVALVRVINEVVNVVSGVLFFRAITVIVSEVVSVVTTALNPRQMVRIVAEKVRIYNTIVRVRALVRIVSEVVYVLDSIVRLKFMTRIVSETINVVESNLRLLVLNTLSGPLLGGVKVLGNIHRVAVVSPFIKGVKILTNRKDVDIDV